MLIELYSNLQRLFPRSYRDEFGEELEIVFQLAADDAANRGTLAIMRLMWREIRDLPGALMSQYSRGRRTVGMDTLPGGLADNGRSSRSQALIATVPFLILGLVPFMPELLVSLAWVEKTNSESIYWTTLTATILPLLIGFIVGWAKGFPRWSLPYAVLAIVGLGVTLGNNVDISFASAPWLSYKMCLAAGILMVTGMLALLGGLSRPLRSFRQSIRRDWTRLSFGLYSTVPLSIFLALDEIPLSRVTPYVAGACLTVLVGAVAYMRCTTQLRRVLSLLICVTTAMIVTGIGRAFYWDGLLLAGMRQPGSWIQAARSTVSLWGSLMVMITSPVLVGLLPNFERSVVHSPKYRRGKEDAQ